MRSMRHRTPACAPPRHRVPETSPPRPSQSTRPQQPVAHRLHRIVHSLIAGTRIILDHHPTTRRPADTRLGAGQRVAQERGAGERVRVREGVVAEGVVGEGGVEIDPGEMRDGKRVEDRLQLRPGLRSQPELAAERAVTGTAPPEEPSIPPHHPGICPPECVHSSIGGLLCQQAFEFTGMPGLPTMLAPLYDSIESCHTLDWLMRLSEV